MPLPDPKKVARLYRTASMARTAGEVRFVKDRGGDKTEWGWSAPGPSKREVPEDFIFNAKHLKPLALVLRSSLMALGHATSAHARLVKVKSRDVSPDGNIGGRGYIMKIPDMRRQLMNCVEVLSAMTDTIYDELKATHWQPGEDKIDARDRAEVRDIIEDAEEIKEDPEGWAEEEEEEVPKGKQAGTLASSVSKASVLVQDLHASTTQFERLAASRNAGEAADTYLLNLSIEASIVSKIAREASRVSRRIEELIASGQRLEIR